MVGIDFEHFFKNFYNKKKMINTIAQQKILYTTLNFYNI